MAKFQPFNPSAHVARQNTAGYRTLAASLLKTIQERMESQAQAAAYKHPAVQEMYRQYLSETEYADPTMQSPVPVPEARTIGGEAGIPMPAHGVTLSPEQRSGEVSVPSTVIGDVPGGHIEEVIAPVGGTTTTGPVIRPGGLEEDITVIPNLDGSTGGGLPSSSPSSVVAGGAGRAGQRTAPARPSFPPIGPREAAIIQSMAQPYAMDRQVKESARGRVQAAKIAATERAERGKLETAYKTANLARMALADRNRHLLALQQLAVKARAAGMKKGDETSKTLLKRLQIAEQALAQDENRLLSSDLSYLEGQNDPRYMEIYNRVQENKALVDDIRAKIEEAEPVRGAASGGAPAKKGMTPRAKGAFSALKGE